MTIETATAELAAALEIRQRTDGTPYVAVRDGAADWILDAVHAAQTMQAIYECGICGHYHRSDWNGDCREDAERMTLDEVESRFGAEDAGWIEVETPA